METKDNKTKGEFAGLKDFNDDVEDVISQKVGNTKGLNKLKRSFKNDKKQKKTKFKEKEEN